MGFTRDAGNGKLTFNNTPSTTADLNGLSDRIEEAATLSVDTATNLPQASNWAGRRMYVTGEDAFYVWNGSWHREYVPFAMAAGVVAVDFGASDALRVKAFTFPVGRFTVIPKVTASLSNAPGGSVNLIARSVSATNAGASMYVTTANYPTTVGQAFSINVDWVAVQMGSDQAAG